MADITVTAAQVAVVYPDDAEIVQMIAGETITAGQAVYIIAASGKAGVADANAAGKQQFRGIALNAAAAGGGVSVLKRGHVYGYTLSGNYDSLAYLSDTAGSLADGVGTMTVNVGRVVALPNAAATKVLYVTADWLRAWS